MGLTRDNMLFGDNNLQEGRSAYLDAAKGIAMLCIVTGHISYLYTPIDIWMSSFKITLFYFISGYLFSIRNSLYEKRRSLKNKSWRLFKEYLIWSVVAIFVDSVFMMLKNDFIWKRVFDNIIHLLTLRGVSTLWFLPGFMIAQSALVFLGSKKKIQFLY